MSLREAFLPLNESTGTFLAFPGPTPKVVVVRGNSSTGSFLATKLVYGKWFLACKAVHFPSGAEVVVVLPPPPPPKKRSELLLLPGWGGGGALASCLQSCAFSFSC